MRLLDATASPFCRKARVLLHETGLIDQVDIVDAHGHPTAPNPQAKAHNPLAKIPTLLRDDGPALYDSRVICRYLDHLSGGNFYPESYLWEVLTLEATADGLMDAAVLMVYEGRSRAADKQDPIWVDAQWSKASGALDVLEARWMSHLSGPLDMGQIAVGCALGYLDFRHGDRDWRKTHESLATWYASFSLRPSMVATAP